MRTDESDRRLWRRYARGLKEPDSCPEPLELAALIDRTAAPELRDRLEAHLAECAECRATFLEVYRPAGELGGENAPPTSGGESGSPHRRDTGFRARVALAASVGAAIVAGGLPGFLAGTRTAQAITRVQPAVTGQLVFGLADDPQDGLRGFRTSIRNGETP